MRRGRPDGPLTRRTPLARIWLDKVEVEPGAPAAIIDLAYCQCRYPLEPGEGSFFCTEMRESLSKPYCAAHNRLCTRIIIEAARK